ncbi:MULTISPECIES: hypothetical protein [Helicobacter]|nr:MULTISPECIES: hypothetical protein [Helicobacter]
MKKTIYAGILSLIFIAFYSGCAAMQDSKSYEMKKSPCACMSHHIA